VTRPGQVRRKRNEHGVPAGQRRQQQQHGVWKVSRNMVKTCTSGRVQPQQYPPPFPAPPHLSRYSMHTAIRVALLLSLVSAMSRPR
jgi:hypothetical protein